MSDNKDTRTATQKIEDLERVVTMLYTTVGALDKATKSLMGTQSDMALVRDALRLLNKKTEAIVQSATPESGITAESVSALVIKMNVEDLKAQVEEYLKRGNLVPADEVGPTSYLVCEESNADGTIANPRIQFRLDSQDEATQAALTGKKAGDSASFGEGKFSATILEVYTLVDNPAPTPAPEAAPTATPEATPEPQAAAQTTTDNASAPPQAEATREAPDAAPQNTLPEESPVAFGLTFHGQPEADLSNQSAPTQS